MNRSNTNQLTKIRYLHKNNINRILKNQENKLILFTQQKLSTSSIHAYVLMVRIIPDTM